MTTRHPPPRRACADIALLPLVISGVSELNISAEIGNYMFGFMWTASAFALFSWLIQTGLCCCCASRRDVRTGRRKGNEKAYRMKGVAGAEAADGGEANVVQEKKSSSRRGWTARKRGA